MRIMGRLLIELRKLTGNDESLSSFLRPESFDDCLVATRSLSKYTLDKENAPEMGTPSLALKVGYSLSKVAGLERGAGARMKARERVEELGSFIDLINNEWATRISKLALNTLAENSYNKVDYLPLTDDLVKLRNELCSGIEKYTARLQLNTDLQTWRELAEYTVTRIVIFNRRHSKEGAKITIEQLNSRPKWNNIKQIEDSLKPLEVKLSRRLDYFLLLIDTPAKKQGVYRTLKTLTAIYSSQENLDI